MTTAKSTAPKKRASKKESGPKSNKKGAVHKQVKEDRRAKAHPDSKPNPLTPMFQTIGVVWIGIAVLLMLWNHSNGTLMPDWWTNMYNPGSVTTSQMEAGDGENYPVVGDTVSIEYTASVKATGRAFDTTQGRGPMQFEIGQDPPKVLMGLDMGVRNMTLGETAEMEISSQYAFGSRAIGEGENVVPPNSDVTFVVKLVAINELLAPEVEEEEEVFEDNWDDLSEEEQASATVLGWTTETWGQHTAKTQTAWDQLSEEDVEAAEALGYDQETWEDPEEFIDPNAEAEEGDEGEEGGE